MKKLLVIVAALIAVVVVAFMSWRLMSHYNLRITRTRDDARKLVDQMKEKYDIDYDSITDKHVALDYVGPIATGRSCKCLRAL